MSMNQALMVGVGAGLVAYLASMLLAGDDASWKQVLSVIQSYPLEACGEIAVFAAISVLLVGRLKSM